MRGVKLPVQSRKLDLVIESVRYDEANRIRTARAYRRRGVVWGDLALLDRADLMESVESKQRVVTGRQLDIPGDFEVFHDVETRASSGETFLIAGEAAGQGDALNVPLF